MDGLELEEADEGSDGEGDFELAEVFSRADAWCRRGFPEAMFRADPISVWPILNRLRHYSRGYHTVLLGRLKWLPPCRGTSRWDFVFHLPERFHHIHAGKEACSWMVSEFWL
jgi:hypothetical protein